MMLQSGAHVFILVLIASTSPLSIQYYLRGDVDSMHGIRPRSSMGEHNYMLGGSDAKWDKFNLTWFFPQAITNPTYMDLAHRAFNVWQSKTPFKFTNISNAGKHADIVITVADSKHHFQSNCMGVEPCSFEFTGGNLAHSYFPNKNSHNCVEIHMDANRRWYLGVDTNVPEGETSFLMVLTHEIGHTLGLAHSANSSSIMFPFYHEQVQELQDDDIHAIEALYGMRKTFASIPPSILHDMPSTVKPTSIKHLCNIRPELMFLGIGSNFQNYHLFIGYDQFVWRLDLNDMSIPQTPEYITNYLPKDLHASHVYQNAIGDLVTFSNDSFYTSSIDTLKIRSTFSILPKNAHINAVFQINSGRSYVLYNNNFYIEFNDAGVVISRGSLHYLFPGIPNGVELAFRYTDGFIYFFHMNIYYKYSEYTRRVVESGTFSWELFNIPCPEDLLRNLKKLMSQIISIYE